MMKKLIFLLLLTTVFPENRHILKSAIIPGWGELALQETHRAHSFFLRESIIVLTLLGGNYTHTWYRNDYQAMARTHAGVDTAHKSYQYYVDMGNYMSLEEFNVAKDRRREVHLKYDEDSNFDWDWDSESNQKKFDDMRITSATGKKVASFAVGAMVAHRIISMIDVLYLERKTSGMKLNSSLIPLSRDEMLFQVSLIF